MAGLYRRFNRLDVRVTEWMARHGVTMLRIAVGIVYFWFGVLKFFPGASPAQDLATRTTAILTFGLIPAAVSLPLLAAWECLIGLGMIAGKFMRVTIFLLLLQMAGTITPMAFFPGETFIHFPYAPTLEGQYIIKNIVLISAALVVGATVRGGRIVADPEGIAVR
jgi:uncharacterized membrane protein YphA (DoxX/SURF4 family)